MAVYHSFNEAERALDNFSGHETERGFRPMTPHERRQAQRLLKDRRSAIIDQGKMGIARQRQSVSHHGERLVQRYEIAEQLFDDLDDSIEAGTVSVADIEAALADAARLHAELGQQVDGHVQNAAQAAQEHDPEKFMRDLYRRYPALGREGRINPWSFPW